MYSEVSRDWSPGVTRFSSKRPARIRTAVVALYALALAGCSPVDELDGWPPEGAVTERVSHSAQVTFGRKNWRDAVRLPERESKLAVNLGAVGEAAALHFGVLIEGDHAQPDAVRVEIDGEPIGKPIRLRPVVWNDHVIDLSAYHEEAECRVIFDIPETFWLSPMALQPPEADGPNVLVFLVDTVRADHCGLYGYHRDTTPNVDAFADRGVTFDQFVCASSWTRPSVASLLSGTYPGRHGARSLTDVMRDDVPRLATILEENGYVTYGLSRNANVNPYWAIGDEFYNFEYFGGMSGDLDVIRSLERKLPQMKGRKWFMYVHLLDPHGPYVPDDVRYGPLADAARDEYAERILEQVLHPGPDYKLFAEQGHGIEEDMFDELLETRRAKGESAPPFQEAIRGAIDLYDSELYQSDAYFGRVLALLKETRQLDDTLIIFLSDHGEEFYDHGAWWHGYTLYEEVIRSPLVMRFPGDEHGGRRAGDLVEMVDIAPTILDYLGIKAPASMEGRSVWPVLEGDELDAKIGYATVYQEKPPTSLSSAQRKKLKVIVDHHAGTESWYDLASDPGETSPLTVAPAGGEALLARIDLLRFQARDGLHIVFTSPLREGEVDVYEGSLTASGMKDWEMRYPAEHFSVEQSGDRLSFRIEMSESFATYDEHRIAHAELLIEAPATGELDLDVDLNGEAVDVFERPAGPEPRVAALGDGPHSLRDLIADRSAGAVELPTGRAAIHCWYVPDPKSIPRDEMDEEMRRTLEGMGYL